MPQYRPLLDRFTEKYAIQPEGCWIWSAAKNEKGYGIIGVDAYKTRRAHLVSWELYRGAIPKGVFACHHCDRPECVNPDHLFLGTPKDNSADMVAKRRGKTPDNRGERATWRKLSAEQARDIASRRISARKFAALYGVSRSAVFRIWEGKNWKSEVGLAGHPA